MRLAPPYRLPSAAQTSPPPEPCPRAPSHSHAVSRHRSTTPCHPPNSPPPPAFPSPAHPQNTDACPPRSSPPLHSAPHRSPTRFRSRHSPHTVRYASDSPPP